MKILMMLMVLTFGFSAHATRIKCEGVLFQEPGMSFYSGGYDVELNDLIINFKSGKASLKSYQMSYNSDIPHNQKNIEFNIERTCNGNNPNCYVLKSVKEKQTIVVDFENKIPDSFSFDGNNEPLYGAFKGNLNCFYL